MCQDPAALWGCATGPLRVVGLTRGSIVCLRYTYDVTLLNLAVATVVGRSEDRGQDSMSSSNDPRQCYSEPFAWIIAMDNCEIRRARGPPFCRLAIVYCANKAAENTCISTPRLTVLSDTFRIRFARATVSGHRQFGMGVRGMHSSVGYRYERHSRDSPSRCSTESRVTFVWDIKTPQYNSSGCIRRQSCNAVHTKYTARCVAVKYAPCRPASSSFLPRLSRCHRLTVPYMSYVLYCGCGNNPSIDGPNLLGVFHSRCSVVFPFRNSLDLAGPMIPPSRRP